MSKQDWVPVWQSPCCDYKFLIPLLALSEPKRNKKFICSCGKTLHLSEAVPQGFQDPLPPVPLEHGGFDLESKSLDQMLIEINEKTIQYWGERGVSRISYPTIKIL